MIYQVHQQDAELRGEERGEHAKIAIPAPSARDLSTTFTH